MSNQLILGLIIILPWLTLFFMKKEDIKRYMPVALFAVFIGEIIVQSGETLKLWVTKETFYPLKALSQLFGLNPVSVIWIFKLTYGRFGLFLVVDAVFNLVFTYLYSNYFLTSRGIFQYLVNPFYSFLMVTAHGIILYGYQMWQEGIFARPNKDKL